MSELTLTGMRVVYEVGARGSFTAAAGALGYTQSAVSRQVSLAEQAVGAKLFERGSRGVRATQRGELLLRRAKAILAQVDAAMLEQDELGEPLSDRLTVGAFPTALAALVPQALARVRAEHPALEVKIREGGTDAQLRRLRAGRIDVGVIAVGAGLEYGLEDLEFDQLMRGQAHLIVSAQHRFAERDWVNVAELEDERWIVGEADRSGPQFGAWPTLERGPNIAYTLRDWPGRFGLVAAGLGVAVIPSLLLPALPPGVRALRVEDPQPFRREVLAVTHPDRTASTQTVITAMRKEAARLIDSRWASRQSHPRAHAR
ncbi:MAG TPA: LysR substrate-binding domain-containing protein [Solirubrobacteraceae bacterium]